MNILLEAPQRRSEGGEGGEGHGYGAFPTFREMNALDSLEDDFSFRVACEDVIAVCHQRGFDPAGGDGAGDPLHVVRRHEVILGRVHSRTGGRMRASPARIAASIASTSATVRKG